MKFLVKVKAQAKKEKVEKIDEKILVLMLKKRQLIIKLIEIIKGYKSKHKVIKIKNFLF